MTERSLDETSFWDIAAPLLGGPNVAKSTMMGLPCLRVNGLFFASFDRRTKHLLVKLPAARVDKLIASGEASPFAPGKRRFREWAAIDSTKCERWPYFLDEALAFVGGATDRPSPSAGA
jgi:hypothetical protein